MSLLGSFSVIMTDPGVDPRYSEVFAQWLRGLGEDAQAVSATVASGEPGEASRWLVAGINYIFKSLDLIPDMVDDLGFLDDAFVLRVACSLAVAEEPSSAQSVVERLAADSRSVRDFLKDEGLYSRLEAYVRGLRKGAARGRTVEDIVTDSATRQAFLRDLEDWSRAYKAPSFSRDIKTLVKLKAYLDAKLV